MEYKKTYIDGYNVLRKISRLERLMQSNADAARRGFVEFVRRRARSLGHTVIVFDGHGDVIGGGARISVVYSLTRTADSWIRMSLEKEHHPRMCLVISSDNEVRAHALACGAEVLGAQEFITQKKKEKQDTVEMRLKTQAVSEHEIRFWMREFERDSENNDDGGTPGGKPGGKKGGRPHGSGQ
ncbi:NYN domain-containing protein [bacterium]|nr:NYN domain-containing protein [bacterium]